ncbi:STAS domain-containing protein [Pseudonocardiaceae bacterium YIM PH 21723]|nr:STAS domain-containing protein [Pseudonocardiaceae bacterium YIM PH 21723]
MIDQPGDGTLFAGRRSDLLTVRAQMHGQALVVTFSGEIDLSTVDLVSWAIAESATMTFAPWPLVFDLRQVTFLNSSGIGLLIRCAQQCEAEGVPFRVVAEHGPVSRPIELLGLAPVLPVYTDLEQALQ